MEQDKHFSFVNNLLNQILYIMKDSAFHTMLAVCICGVFLGIAGISANHRAAHAERDIDSLRSGIDLYAIDCEAEGNPAD